MPEGISRLPLSSGAFEGAAKGSAHRENQAIAAQVAQCLQRLAFQSQGVIKVSEVSATDGRQTRPMGIDGELYPCWRIDYQESEGALHLASLELAMSLRYRDGRTDLVLNVFDDEHEPQRRALPYTAVCKALKVHAEKTLPAWLELSDGDFTLSRVSSFGRDRVRNLLSGLSGFSDAVEKIPFKSSHFSRAVTTKVIELHAVNG